MLQILIWAACAIIFGVGYCGMYVEKIAAKEKVKSSTGVAFFVLMAIIAAGLFLLSLAQAQGIGSLLNR